MNRYFSYFYCLVIFCSLFSVSLTLKAQMIYPGDVDFTGPLEIVFDWSTDACVPDNLPDAPVRPFRDAAGNINLNISHYYNYRMTGSDFDNLSIDCQATLVSDFDSLPQNYNGHEWIMSLYTENGVDVAAYVHNEHHAYEYEGQCNDTTSNNYLNCWYNTITYASSSDSGKTYTQDAVPNHYAMGVPYKQDTASTGAYGIFGGSNIIKSPVDGYYYRAIQVENYGAQQVGMSMTRTNDPFDPTSWQGWDGEDFTISFADPYRTPNIIDTQHVVEPVGSGYIEKMNAYIGWSTYFNRFILVGAAQKSGVWGFYYALSNDLIHWTARHPIMTGNMLIDPNVSYGQDIIAYSSLVDHNDTTRNFEVVGQECYLYYVIYHTSGGLFDRDLVRIPIRFNKLEVEGWTINAGGQQYDDNPGDGRCATASGKCNVISAIQESNSRLPMDSSFVATVEFNTTLTNINVNNQMFGCHYPMVFDATGLSGYSANISDFGQSMNLAPAVTLNLKGNGGFAFQGKNSGIKGLAIKNYSGSAVGFTADSGFVESCILGSDAAGLDEYISTTNGTGITIENAAHIRIGGTTADKRNMILGGITLDGSETHDIHILGNYIGTDRNGDSVYYHNTGGITLQNGAHDIAIGGNSLNERNIISGFTAPGITIGTHSYNVEIERNLIGTDLTGTQDRGNLRAGISLGDTSWNVNILNNIIGNNSVDEAGIWAVGSTHDILIQGNYIGTDTTGTLDLGNGTATNQANGIIIGNLAYNVVIGGINPEEANTIAFNKGSGISLYGNAGSGNAILGNNIYDNIKMGIDLQGDNSPHGNDDDDTDTGANDFQNYPELRSATLEGDSLTITGTLNSVPSSTFRIEFFLSAECDTFTASYSGYGEGEEFLGAHSVATNSDGDIDFSFTVFASASLGNVVTTTATNSNNGTSEFSQCETIVSPEADMTLSTHAFLETIASGASASDTLMIYSTGTAELSWSVSNSENWLSTSTGSGNVSSGDSTMVILTYNTSALSTGTHQDTIILTSNDPDQLNQPLSVEIDVQAQPDIFMTFDTLAFVMPEGGVLTKNFTIFNQGSDPLTWQLSTQAGTSWLHMVQPNSGSIAGGSSGSAALKCQDASLPAGVYYAQAWINSNDPDQSFLPFTVELTITVVGGGGGGNPVIKHPDISITTDTLFATIPQGGSQSLSIPMENKGDTTLTWSYHTQAGINWITTFPPTSGNLSANQTRNIQLKAEAGSFSPGTYFAQTWIDSNDPDQNKIYVMVKMTVQDTTSSGGGGSQTGTPDIQFSVNQSSFCPGDSLLVTYQILDTTLESGNIFSLLMSSANGDFNSPDTIANYASDQLQGNFYAVVPHSSATGSNYHFRMVSTKPRLTSSQDADQLTVKSVTSVNLSPFAPVCANATAIELKQGAPTGGQYSGTGVSNGKFNPGGLTSGTYSIQYLYTNQDGCSNDIIGDITILSSPDVTFPATISPMCSTADSIALNMATPVGGTYAGTGVNNSFFLPKIAGIGHHTIRYVVEESGCADSAEVTVVVNAVPQVVFPAPTSDICENAAPIELTMATPSGGIYSGTGIKNGFFEPQQAGPGQHVIGYLVEENGCSDSASITITIQAAPQIFIDPVDPLCGNADSIFLTVTPIGGQFSGNGVTGNQFDPTGLSAGFYTISYQVNEGVCTATSDQQIEVWPVPVTPIIQELGDSLVISGQFDKVEWYFNGQMISDTSGSSHSPDQSGSYSVKVYNVSGCVSISELYTFEVNSTRIGEQFSSSWSVFPNPATSQVTLSWNPTQISARNLDIRVYDNLGRMVSAHRAMTSQAELQLPLDRWSRGVYSIEFRAGQERSVRKLVVE